MPDFEIEYVDIGSVDASSGIAKTETVVFEDAPSRARRIVRDGDTIVSTVRTYLRAIAAIESPPANLIASTGFAVIRPKSIQPAFLAWSLRSSYFIETVVSRSVGVSYPATNASELGGIPLTVPPRSEQRAIADFLDVRTAKLDALLDKKRTLIEKLKEKRSALISRTVTRGLPPDAAAEAELPPNSVFKPSGMEWLGDVPTHWEVTHLKFLATANDEALPECTLPDFEIEYVDIGSVDASSGIAKSETVVFEDAPSRARRIVRDGDTIVSTVRTYLRAIAAIESPPANLIASTGFAVIRPKSIQPAFLAWSLRSPYFIETVVSRSVGVSYPATNASELGGIPLTVPPCPEQTAIAGFLDTETATVDRLIEKVEATIEMLTEYRSALIDAVVTGEIDVRNA